MKTIALKCIKAHLLLVTVTGIILSSCGGGTSKQPANAEGFSAIENEIKDKFGENAYFTDVDVLYIEGIGNSITTTVTATPESLKMGQWDLTQNKWTQRSDISIEIPEGTQAKDFMFQLDNTFSLKKLGELVEQSIQKLKAEKDIENPVLSIASISFPDNGDVSKANYTINLKPESGGTTFTFIYALNGDLEKMDY